MKYRLTSLIAILFLAAGSLSAQQFWDGTNGAVNTTTTINRTGITSIGDISQYPVFQGNPTNPIPLQVRGDNVILSKVFDATDFVALGQSGAGEVACDLWGFRAQRFSNRSVSLGVTTGGDDRAILNWGSGINELLFTTGSDRDCGEQIASFSAKGIRFFVPLLPGRVLVPSIEITESQLESSLRDATDRLMSLLPARVESPQKAAGTNGLYFSSKSELEIEVNSLETFVPEAVATDDAGNKFVDYTEVIPLLVATVQDQQLMIEEQQAQIAQMMQKLEQLDENNLDVIETDNPFLGQNVPNPALNNTSIAYQLPDGINSGSLVIRNIGGQVLLTERLSGNAGAISVDLNYFEPGTYIYSMEVNGSLMSSRRMIIQ